MPRLQPCLEKHEQMVLALSAQLDGMKIQKSHIFTGLALSLLHLGLVGCTYAANVAHGVSYAPILWFFLAVLDFPVGLGVGWDALQVAGNYRWNNELMPLLYFGSVGTIWWFFLGTIGSFLASALRRKFKKRKG
ncbi:MAG: hypothetical protein JRE63_03055 [Deltaproteobacteria bacterium]|nr:hypothetical protein [Deltaproteobacteria bacterium]